MVATKRLFFSATFLLCLTLVIGGCGNENPVTQMSPAQIPDAVIAAAEGAVPGGTVTGGVKTEMEGGIVVYEVQIESLDGVRYEVEVTADGEVLEVEKGDGKDDKDDKNDKDD